MKSLSVLDSNVLVNVKSEQVVLTDAFSKDFTDKFFEKTGFEFPKNDYIDNNLFKKIANILKVSESIELLNTSRLSEGEILTISLRLNSGVFECFDFYTLLLNKPMRSEFAHHESIAFFNGLVSYISNGFKKNILDSDLAIKEQLEKSLLLVMLSNIYSELFFYNNYPRLSISELNDVFEKYFPNYQNINNYHSELNH